MKKILSLSLMLLMSICTAFADDVTINLDPESGSSVGYLYTVGVSVPEVNWLYCGTAKAVLKDADGKEVAKGSPEYSSGYYIQFDKIITTPGTYTLESPEGTFGYYDASYTYVNLPGFTATYTVTGEGMTNCTQSPAADEEVETLSSFTLTFPDVDPEEGIALKSGWNYRYLYDADGNMTKYINLNDGVVSGNSVTFTLSAAILTPGVYTVTFNAGDFLLGLFEEESSPIVATFNVVGNAPVAYEMTPEAGTYSQLKNFSVKFPDATALSKAGYANITLKRQNYSGNDGTYYTSYSSCEIVGTDTYNFQLSETVTDAGDYILNIPAGTFYLDEEKTKFNTEINVAYTLDGNGGDNVTIYPENGSTLSKLESVTLTYPDESLVMLANSYPGASVYKDGVYSFYLTNNSYSNIYDFVAGEEANQQVIKFSHTEYAPDYSSSSLVDVITEPGVYTFTVSAGTYAFDEEASRTSTKLNFTYTVDGTATGIKNVNAANADAPAYNLAGQRVNANTKGIIIKNGKKYLVK